MNSGAEKSSEEAHPELKQLNKEVEELKTGLQEKKAEAEEHLRELDHLKAALDEKKKELQERNEELEEMKNELNELNKLAEEKGREADESMDKYCSLMVKVHKLEETNDALTTRLEQLSASQHAGTGHSGGGQRRRSARKSALMNQQEKLEESENVAPATPHGSPLGPLSAKRGHRDISDRDSAQEALHNLTKKIKATAMTTPKPRSEQQQEEEEFRPEGLPELVQKGMGTTAMISQLLR